MVTRKRTSRKIIAWLLMAAMFFSLDIAAVFAAEDVTDKLDIISKTATQNGVDILEITVSDLDFDKPIIMELEFRVPVLGDGIGAAQAVHKGNTATIELAKGFKVTSGNGPFDLEHNGVKIGTLNLVTTGTGIDALVTADIVFDGEDDVFNGEWGNIICTVNATLEYDGPGADTEDETYTVEILRKSYDLTVPAIPVTLTGEKTGVRNGQFIDWKVRVTADQDGTPADMSGYVFSDDLTDVGEYVPNSFTIGENADGSDAAIPDPTAAYGADEKLTYTFPENTVDTRYIFFSTAISKDMLYSNENETVRNTAKVYDGEIEKFSEDDDVEFKFEWIKKEGATTSFDAVTNTGYITWTITANQGGASLSNAVITDVLDADYLEWQSVVYKIEQVPGAWETHPIIKFEEEPAAGKYELGNINTPVQLTIVAKVKGGVNIGHTVQNITNNATISWDDYSGEGTGIGSGSIGVNIGLNPISKQAGTPDTSTHTIPWTVSVKKSDVNVNLYVLDLLVYGTSFAWDDVASHSYVVGEGIPTPDGLLDLDLEYIKDRAPTARYNQKYVTDSFDTGHDLEHVVYTLKNNADKAIADLLVVTGTGGSSINVTSETQIFTFKSVITNPDIYAKNTTTTVRNTAALYSGDTWLNNASDSVEYTSRMLAKDMLRRGDAANPDTNKNKAGAATGAGYDYVNHTVVFRLHVNANNLKDFTKDLTTVDGIAVGEVTLTDTLPEGWEFVDIATDTKFMLYKGTPDTDGKVTAGDRITSPAFVSGDFTTAGKAVFTFTSLTEPYVILVKAGPTEGTIADYFKQNETYGPLNTATLAATNWTPGEQATQKVEIKSQIIDKNLVAGSGADQGVITWTVDYRPNELEHEGAVIKDKLDVGLDLRIGADGKLILTDGNITAQEMTLNPNGSYSAGAPVVLVQDEGAGQNISYNPETRILQFNIPHSDRAYRLVYKTDVTANAGTLLKNEVELSAGGTTIEGDEGGYTVVDADVTATMQRSGWVEITKRDGTTNAPLAGVVFTLYSTDGNNTVIRTGKTTADGKLTLRGLPVGTYRLEETDTLTDYWPHPYTFTVTVTKEGENTITAIDSQTGEDSNKITIRNYQEDTVGDLTIRKLTTGVNADATKDFSFTLTVTGANGDYEYLGTGGKANGTITFNAAGSATFVLKHGESITIKHLPKDTPYTVTESDYRPEGYATAFESATGTIVADTVVTATYTNSSKGWIEITKLDAADGTTPLAGAEFTLFEADGVTPAAGISVGTTDVNGKLWLLNLVEGSYILKETAAPTDYNIPEKHTYWVLVEEVAGKLVASIESSDDNKITIVNYEAGTVGDLAISKTIAGGAADRNKEFNFTVTISGISGDYDYIGSGGKESGVLTFDLSGSATFTLKGGESIRIKYLPVGVAYTVQEEDYSSERYRTTQTGDVGSIVADEIVTAAFVNTKPSLPVPSPTGGLMITKTVTGEGADRTKHFAFTVTLGRPGETYEYSGVGIPSGTLISGDTIMLAHGQSITIAGLPAETAYSVVERDYSTEGYVTTAEYADGVIEANAIKVARFLNTYETGMGDGALGSIELRKTDANFLPLAGAEFTLYDSEGEVVLVTTSGADGIVRFVDVPLGSYTIRETAAPQGYNMLDQELTVVLTVEDEVVQTSPYTIVNEKSDEPDEPGQPGQPGEPGEETPGEPGQPGQPGQPGEELPKAGGLLDTAVLIVGGVLMILLGLGYAFMKRRTRDHVA